MQRKVVSGNQAKYCTQPKAGLATFYGIGYVSCDFILILWFFCTTYGLIFWL